MKKSTRKKTPSAKTRSAKRARPRSAKSSRGERSRTADPKAIVRRWFEELWNKRNSEILKELLHADAVGETEGGRIVGHDEFLQKLHSPLIGAFPDLRVTVDDVIADGDKAAVRWTFQATHAGDTLGIPATQRRVKVSGMSWIQCKDGRLVAGWDRWNSAGLMAYLKDGAACPTVGMPTDG